MWDTAAARCTSTLHGHTDAILDFDLSSDGRFALSCGMDGTVRLWGVSTSACYRVYRSHAPGAWVKMVRFTPDGAGFVSAGLDNRWVTLAPLPCWRCVVTEHTRIVLWVAVCRLVHWSLASDARQPVRSWMAHDDHVRTSLHAARTCRWLVCIDWVAQRHHTY